MISHQEIKNLVAEWGLPEDIIEKDYVIGWLLWGLAGAGTVTAAFGSQCQVTFSIVIKNILRFGKEGKHVDGNCRKRWNTTATCGE